MAQFNIDSHLSDGQRLSWLVIAEAGESLQDAVAAVKEQAARKFGPIVKRHRWTVIRASNGAITVSLHR